MNQNKNYYLKVVTVANPVEAANGNGSYKKVTLQQWVTSEKTPKKFIDSPTAKLVTMNLWTEQKRNDGSMSKRHFLYDSIIEGMELEGVIDTLDTSEYTVETNGVTRTARKLTVIAFEGENIVDVANSQLSQRDACVVRIDDEGTVTPTLNLQTLRETNALRTAERNKDSKPEGFKNTETPEELAARLEKEAEKAGS